MTRSTATSSPLTATIVGAGLGGLMMAIRLAQRGYQVDLYERRCQVEGPGHTQRSFTVTLSARGLAALAEIDLREETLALTVGIQGRMIHARDGSTTYVPYSKDPQEQLHAIRRHDMNALLYRAASRYPTITCHFNQRLVELNKKAGILWFADEAHPDRPPVAVPSPLIIGCDGIFSTVRQQMHKGERADYHQDCLDWGYKDVLVPAGPQGRPQLVDHALHIWPRGHCTFFAFPTLDGSFAGNFIAPFTLAAQLTTVEATTALLATDFADLLALAPALPLQLATLPMSNLITTTTAPWFYEDKIVLLGDAVHAVTPFWGEGMNAAYEDSSVLDQYLAETPTDRAAAFARYQALRKPNSDLLGDLAKQNFLELRAGSGTLAVTARKLVEQLLYRLLPTWWLPLHIMISHRLYTYQAAVDRDAQQRRWARRCGIDLVIGLVMGWLALQQGWKQLGRLWRGRDNDERYPAKGALPDAHLIRK